MLAAGALKALDIMAENTQMFSKIHELAEEMHNAFEDLPGLVLIGDRISVVKHLRLKEPHESRQEDRAILNDIVLRVSLRSKRACNNNNTNVAKKTN